MLVLEEGKEFGLHIDYKEWQDHTPNAGAILEVHLPDTDYAPAPDVSVGFLVMGSAVGADGSAPVEVKYLGGGDAELSKEFSGHFNRRKGYLHLCPGAPCFSDGEFRVAHHQVQHLLYGRLRQALHDDPRGEADEQVGRCRVGAGRDFKIQVKSEAWGQPCQSSSQNLPHPKGAHQEK